MLHSGRQSINVSNVLSVIMGGGQGTRLFPLTKERAKPAVPLAGKYRLVDIPISNCINSGFRRIYILTQFNSASLHSHISARINSTTFRAASWKSSRRSERSPTRHGIKAPPTPCGKISCIFSITISITCSS